MSKLHYVRVRRARGLAMPLPPKPKARPLGPPVLFYYIDEPIRTRADIERTGQTWEGFCEWVAGYVADGPLNPRHWTMLDDVAALVPEADRGAHRLEMARLISEERARTWGSIKPTPIQLVERCA